MLFKHVCVKIFYSLKNLLVRGKMKIASLVVEKNEEQLQVKKIRFKNAFLCKPCHEEIAKEQARKLSYGRVNFRVVKVY